MRLEFCVLLHNYCSWFQKVGKVVEMNEAYLWPYTLHHLRVVSSQ
jgi:hypothetical protein